VQGLGRVEGVEGIADGQKRHFRRLVSPGKGWGLRLHRQGMKDHTGAALPSPKSRIFDALRSLADSSQPSPLLPSATVYPGGKLSGGMRPIVLKKPGLQ
ncbi:hypothetical protein, partial [Sphingobium sp. Sx8-8]|uniref:hypothetical protein n=1 Tax=Sphingobium sp. Sx8-8 TaxID=2933617 RepID=UPI001F5A3BA7